MITKLPSDVSNLFTKISYKSAVFVFSHKWMEPEDLETLVKLRLQCAYEEKREIIFNWTEYSPCDEQLFHFAFASMDRDSSYQKCVIQIVSERNLVEKYNKPNIQNWKKAYQEAVDLSTEEFRALRHSVDFNL